MSARTPLRSLLVALLLLVPGTTRATQFSAGAIIIPMDIDYQDDGMLRAYGLLFQLLQANVPVHWVIEANKQIGDTDFTATAQDFLTGDPISAHGYRGGPFVIEAQHDATASPVITAWQTLYPETVVHVAQQGFVGRTGRLLTAAPTIAVIADGNEDIAFKYLNAAGIPDSAGQAWPNKKQGNYTAFPDILTIEEIAGPTDTDHADGALLRPSGEPAFCQVMTMHWSVNDVVDEVVAEYRSFLQFPTHMMAECQAVNAIENNVFGRFLTPNGFLIDNNVKDEGPFEFLNADTPFGQMDGPYELVGGSERAYSLPAGDSYYDQHVVMIKDAATTLGQRSVWMTGYIDGACSVEEGGPWKPCSAGVGKISYLGGHKYEVKLPISNNPDTQGTRLFLNSLFEASCTTSEGQPQLNLTKSGPDYTAEATVTYTLYYVNVGPGSALDATLQDTLPAGASFVSCTGGCSSSGNTVTWSVGDIGSGNVGSVQLTVAFSQYGTYQNDFSAEFVVGVNTKSATSNLVSTVYQSTPPPDGGNADGSVVADAAADSAPGNDAAAGDGATGDGTVLDSSTPGSDGALDGTTPGTDATPDGGDDSTAGADSSAPGDDAVVDAAAGEDGSGAEDAAHTTSDSSAGDADNPPGAASEGCDCSLTDASPRRSTLLLWLLVIAALGIRRRKRLP